MNDIMSFERDRAVLILSGGVDSMTLLHDLVLEQKVPLVRAIGFRYGQRHSKELDQAKKACRRLDVPFEEVSLDFLIPEGSALLNPNEALPHDVEGDPQPRTYVPFRNLLFLTIAAHIAESLGASTIYYGAQKGDLYGYWDCTRDFVEAVQDVFQQDRKTPMKLRAPYVEMTKAEVVARGLRIGVDYSQTWSCYAGNEVPCGVCPTCQERISAFSSLGEKDPLYDSGPAGGK